MTHPNSPEDDSSWDELARELGIDEIAAKIDAVPVEDEPLAEELGEYEEEGVVEAEPGAAEGEADDGEDGEGDGAEGTEETTGDDQPGIGRKRRRRRRRRRGKGAPGELVGTEAAASSADDAPEPDAPVAVDRPTLPMRSRSVVAREAIEDGEESDELETPGMQPAAEEDTGSEVLRELIASWNVPAWDDIVTGLYRPDR